MTHHYGIGTHGYQRIQRVDQGFALGCAGGLRSDGYRLGAQPAGGDFEAYAGAGGGFKKEIDDHLAAKSIEAAVVVSLGERLEKNGTGEDGFDFGPVEALDIEQASGLGRHFRRRRQSFAPREVLFPCHRFPEISLQ